jgi:VanZ family protein
MGAGRRKYAAAVISLLIYLGIFALSSLPASALPANIPDVIPHFGEYALLAFFFIQLFGDPGRLRALAIGLAALILLALLDELHQAFVPGRFCSLKDGLADVLGSLAGIAACLVLRRWAARPHRRSWARWLGDYFSRT